LAFAIPDHPWVDSAQGAAVRVAMTVGAAGAGDGRLLTVVEECTGDDGVVSVRLRERSGRINADLTVGADVSAATVLAANAGLSFMGCTPVGEGFLVSADRARELAMAPGSSPHIRPYINGKDLADRPRGVYALDFFGLDADTVRDQFPSAYQHVLLTVKPERDQNKRDAYREKWWIFAEARAGMRKALSGLSRYIATCRTAKHRIFQFLDVSCLPDSKVIAIASDDAGTLGVVSSRIHLCWAIATGSFLGIGNDSNYNNSECFGKFPFPDPTDPQRERIRALAEQLDAHRKRQQAAHPGLTLTGLYNVLAALREGRALTAKERTIHDQGLVGILRQLHDDLDAAVADAYGWPADLPDDEVLTRLVALNRTRADEEAQGHIRWLRPDLAPLGAPPLGAPAFPGAVLRGASLPRPSRGPSACATGSLRCGPL
jgi:hypothetical protein